MDARDERRAQLEHTRAQIELLKAELGVDSSPPLVGGRVGSSSGSSSRAAERSRYVDDKRTVAGECAAPPSPPPSPKCSSTTWRRLQPAPSMSPGRLPRAPAAVSVEDDGPLQFPSQETVASIVALKCELGLGASPGALVRPTPVAGSPRAGRHTPLAIRTDRSAPSLASDSPAGGSPVQSPVAEPHGAPGSPWEDAAGKGRAHPPRKESVVQQHGDPETLTVACEPKRISFV
jgi:hypothetical protein